jgi:putative cell wall-binding protein
VSSASKGLRRAGVGGLSALLAATAMTGLASTASATTDATFTRVAGADRYATSAATAKLFGSTTDVILASGEPGHTVDALTASFLAGFKKAPVLLTHLNETPKSVMDQIKASTAKNIWIVGGTGAVSAAQEQALKDAGYAVARLAGADRWGTSKDVIDHTENSGSTALLATGLDFPDALGGGALSYAAGLPMALVKKDSVPADTLAALKGAGIKDVIIVGGEGVVSAQVVTALAAEGITVKARVGGANRAETSAMLADYEIANYGFTNTAANIASGYAFGDGADALGGAAFSGEKKTPLLITNSQTKADPLVAWLTTHAKTVAGGYVFGGPGAVSDALVAQLQAAARNVSSNQDFVVSPAGDQTKSASTTDGSADNAGRVSYTITGLDDAKTYTIALLPCDDVTNTNSFVKFSDADGTNGAGDDAADGEGTTSTGAAVIETANNAAVGAQSTTGVQPLNGTILFGVDSTQEDCAVAVVYEDADASGDLTLGADNTPTEAFAVTGKITWTPREAADGAGDFSGVVTSVDKDANSFSLDTDDDEAADVFVKYDANDFFDTVAGSGRTLAQFEAALSTGDSVYVGSYNTDAAGQSYFSLYNDTPDAPTVAASVGTGQNSNDVTLTITPTDPSDIADYDSFVVQRATGSGAFSTIATATKDAVSTVDGFQYVDNNVAAGTYRYQVAGVIDGDQGEFSAPTANQVTTNPVADDTTRPTITDARVGTDVGTFSGFADAGDVWYFTFSEAVKLPTGTTTTTIRVSDADGTVMDFTGTATIQSTNAAGDTVGTDRVMEFTLGVDDTIVEGTNPTLAYPATIQGFPAAVTDAAGNQVTLTNSDTSIS